MSDEARNYVKRYSPFTGTTFWFHYVMADIANAQHGYELFVGDARLTREWPFSRRAIVRSRAELLEAGFLTQLGTSQPGRPVRYRFEFPDVVENARHIGACSTQAKKVVDVSQFGKDRAPNVKIAPLTNRSEPKEEPAPKARPPKPTDDPVKAHAWKLAQFAYEQPVTPSTRGGFAGVMARIEAELRAGTIEQHIKAAILAGDVTWTADGLRTAIGKAKPKQRADPVRRVPEPTIMPTAQRAALLESQRKARALPK